MALQGRTIRLSSRLWAEVDALAQEDGVSSAEIVREAVVRLLERAQNAEKPPVETEGSGNHSVEGSGGAA